MTEKIKNMVASVISVLLTITLLATCGMMLFKLTIISPQSYTKAFEEKRLYNEIYDNMYMQINKYISTNNIVAKIVDGMITKNEVTEIVDNYIFSAIGYIKKELNNIPKADLSIYEARLNQNINQFIEEYKNNEDYDSDEEFNMEADKIKADIMTIVKSNLDMIDVEKVLSSGKLISVSNLTKIVDNGFVILGLLIVVSILCGIYIMIWKRRKTRKFMWMGSSFAASGGIMLVAVIIWSTLGLYKRSIIDLPYLSDALSFVIKKFLVQLSIMGGVLLVIGLAFVGVHIMHKIKKKNKELILRLQ